MKIKPCVVIPCYNHGYAIDGILAQLARFDLSVVIVNDGSTDGTRASLEAACHRYSGLEVINRPHNGGKGAALCDGLAWACGRGYSHAVLIDSDGQHAIDDVPRLLEVAESAPDSIVLGSPCFGADAPVSRRIGREISNIFVALVTARWAARDVLCGFRVLPLKVVSERLRLSKLQPRMGFDAEIVVRALWEGVSLINVPTHVTYPVGGVSHFKYGSDNLQLARLYVRLLAEGLWMVPRRWCRDVLSRDNERRNWFQIAERGSLGGLRFLLTVLERVGRIPLLILMIPIVLHMFVWGRATRRSAVMFQGRISSLRGESPSALALHARAFRQFWEFGVSIVEKVVSWRDGIPLEKFTWVGRDEVKAQLAQSRGLIFMSAHVGNIEVIRAFGETRKVVINALMFTGNSRHFRAILEEVNSRSFVRVIDISAMDPSVLFDLRERLARGEVVALLGDRAPKDSVGRVVDVPFLGGSARFPEGPWIFASLLEAPLYTVFSMREPGGRYRVEFTRLADRISLPRESRGAALRGYISEFALRLGEIAQRYPYQWFNFYPFWDDERVAEAPAPNPVTLEHAQ